MSTLDSPHMIDQSTVSPFPTAVRYGLIGGLILVAYALLGNLTGLTKPSSGLALVAVNGLISIVLYIVILVMAVRKHRNEDLGGYVTFGRAFVVALLVSVIASVIQILFNYLYMTVIDPSYTQTMIEEMQVMYEKMGMNEEQIDAAMVQIEQNFQPGRMITQGLIWSIVIGAIISLIIAAVMQRKPKTDMTM